MNPKENLIQLKSKFNRPFRFSFRSGFTLIEVMFALTIAGSAGAIIFGLIAKAIQSQNESVHISNAVHLAKIKMAQIDSSTSMETNTTRGEIPGYPGYEFETIIEEKERDLLKMATGQESEELKSKTPKDLLGDRDANLNDILKNRGQMQGSQTGGLIKIFEIKITITYPLGRKKEKYTVETFRATKY
jgi:general secretion pathway protein I